MAVHLPDPFRALTGAFFARFFENEITTGFDDLKSSFFWLLAALAIPGMFIPWIMAFDWHLIAMLKGPLALREASQAEKVFYLGFAMIASGLLTTIAWSTLLPDRRDTLILGTLPVGSPTIVAAKLAALTGYVLLIAAAMHVIGAVFFGAVLATNTGTVFAVRGILAHLLAAAAASAAVAFIVAAAQGLTLAIAGPRLFRRLTTLLQACLVGLMAVGLALLPIIMFSIVHTVRGFGGRMRPWVLSTPPAWFLGLYEWLLGTTDPVLLGLARNAGLTLLLAVGITLVTYPTRLPAFDGLGRRARRRPRARNLIVRALRGLLIGAAGKHPEARAAADFYTATIARVERHRFVLAMAVGIAIAWVMVGWLGLDPPSEPAAGWLSLPLSTMIFVTVGLSIAASLPGDVRSGWLFELKEPSRTHARRALERDHDPARRPATDARRHANHLVAVGPRCRPDSHGRRTGARHAAPGSADLALRRNAVRTAMEARARESWISLAALRCRLLRGHDRHSTAGGPALRPPLFRHHVRRAARLRRSRNASRLVQTRHRAELRRRGSGRGGLTLELASVQRFTGSGGSGVRVQGF